jgi:hypothetical protein
LTRYLAHRVANPSSNGCKVEIADAVAGIALVGRDG